MDTENPQAQQRQAMVDDVDSIDSDISSMLNMTGDAARDPGEPKAQRETVAVRTLPARVDPALDPDDEAAPRTAAPQRDPSMMALHQCGLPRLFVVSRSGPKRGKQALVRFVQMYVTDSKQRKELEITSMERDKYAIYRKAAGAIRVDMRMFVAALRLYHAGFSLTPPPPLNLNDLPRQTTAAQA